MKACPARGGATLEDVSGPLHAAWARLGYPVCSLPGGGNMVTGRGGSGAAHAREEWRNSLARSTPIIGWNPLRIRLRRSSSWLSRLGTEPWTGRPSRQSWPHTRRPGTARHESVAEAVHPGAGISWLRHPADDQRAVGVRSRQQLGGDEPASRDVGPASCRAKRRPSGGNTDVHVAPGRR